MKTIIQKLHLDKALLVLRAITLFTWIIMLILSVNVSIAIQVMLVAVIFISDALDGIISRRFTTVVQQYRFRILDAFVDKIGMLAFLCALLWLERVTIQTFSIIIGYNVLLIIPPVFMFMRNSPQKIDWIQATIWSRFYAISVGLYCFLAIITDVAYKYSILCTGYFLAIGLVSFISHIVKIRGLKGVS